MRDLYRRLRKVGFDAAFVRARILPDWWEDSQAQNPANRAFAEGCISRMLGFQLAALKDPDTALRLPPMNDVRLKKRKGTSQSALSPGILLAQNAARGLVRALRPGPRFGGPHTAREVREQILRNRACVDLAGLLDFSWNHGVAVFHIHELPKASKRFSGMAMYVAGMPVVVLASRRDSPPWLAFHLAHELGHLLLEHVRPDGPPLADGDLDRVDGDDEEKAADAFACEVLTGKSQFTANSIHGLRGPNLASLVRDLGKQSQIDPGALALVYGWTAERMPVAQAALKILGMDSGAHAAIADRLREQLADEVPESLERFVSLVTAA